MEPWILIAAVVVAFLIAAALTLRRGRGAAEAEARLARLTEVTEKLAAGQAELAGHLKMAQSGFNERLDAIAKRVGDGLMQHTEKTGETLTALQKRLAVIDEAQRHITDLSRQMVGLQEILSNKQLRGAFGQGRLEDLVRDALPPTAYDFQVTLSNGKRADCVVKLPTPPGPIAVDSKFPLEAYRALQEARDETASAQAARAFVADLSRHVDDIADKYIIPSETADWALLFLPSEAIYAEVHSNFPGVVEKAHRRRVAIVSPSTLMAALTTVRAILRDAQMKEQAERIQIEMARLLNDVRLMDERVGNLQRHFEQAGKDIDQIATSTRKIAKSGERIREVHFDESPPEPSLPSS
jgi:DNA recombination protein RmuC